MSQTRLTREGFITGIIAGLALKHYEVVTYRVGPFHAAMAAAFNDIWPRAEAQGMRVMFRIRLSLPHRRSAEAEYQLAFALQNGLITIDVPRMDVIRLVYGSDWAAEQLERLPGGRELYEPAVAAFLKSLRAKELYAT